MTLLTQEGGYPYSHGTASRLCDRLLRGMPDVGFDILTVVTDRVNPIVWEVPHNVARVLTVPTWGPPHAGRALRSRRLREFLSRYENFLLSLLRVGSPEGFADGLCALAAHSRAGELSATLRTDAAARTLAAVWRHPDVAGSVADATRHDARQATDLLEQTLRPLAAPSPRTDLTHAVGGGLAALPGLVARHFEDVPLLLSEHGEFQPERYLGHRAGPYRWPVKALLLGFHRLLARETNARADLVTFGGHYHRRWVEHGGTEVGRIGTVYGGIEPELFPRFAKPEPQVPTLVWAGRIDPIKDLETLIRCFHIVRRELPEARLRLFGPVASGAERYRDHCQALIAELGLTNAVTFEGRVSDIESAYAAGNIVMLSSVSEGFPFSVVEAMAFGRVPVSTAVRGAREAVGDAGLVVPLRDPLAMAQAALGLLRNPARRAAMVKVGRQRVIEQFMLRHTTDSFRSFYLSLAGQSRGAGTSGV
ncbi:DUF3492 domain-containing protein [Streptomyces sp. KS 21]|uniref:DUF3492 domain-containing protein n=1 Tax=Streptomyces sp. KS 21 TaxID=2485150 RepID=UPI001FB96E02|nr:DUF3492 domain-containing protein [Streptomyces sp. KS 21]